MSTYVINSSTLGVSTYSGGFNDALDITEHSGGTYLITASAFHQQTGDDDDGTNIDAYVQTGQLDFGDKVRLKSVPRAYIHMVANKKVDLSTITNERNEQKTRAYEVRKHDESYPLARTVKLGRGVNSVSWGFKIANSSGGTFEIDSFSVLPRISHPVR